MWFMLLFEKRTPLEQAINSLERAIDNKNNNAERHLATFSRIAFEWQPSLWRGVYAEFDQKGLAPIHYLAIYGITEPFTEENFHYKFNPHHKDPKLWRQIEIPDRRKLTPPHYAALNGQMSVLRAMFKILHLTKRPHDEPYDKYNFENLLGYTANLPDSDYHIIVKELLRYRIHTLLERKHVEHQDRHNLFDMSTKAMVEKIEELQDRYNIAPSTSIPTDEEIKAVCSSINELAQQRVNLRLELRDAAMCSCKLGS